MGIKVRLVNRGWRSYIECSLCAYCPQDSNKGCCHINPVYSLAELLYFRRQDRPFLQQLLGLEGACLERQSLVVNNNRSGVCAFHSPQGCRLAPEQRNFICRIFICPEVRIWHHRDLAGWKAFFGILSSLQPTLSKPWRKMGWG